MGIGGLFRRMFRGEDVGRGVNDLAYRLELRDYANVTPSIGTERDDDRHRIRFGIEKPLLEYATARFEYRHLTSNSNLPEADYDENTVEMTLGVEF